MNLKVLNKTELDSRIKTLAGKERGLLLEIILTIKEIDSRRSYLDLGYPNLFTYLVEGVGYSAGSAQRRIDAARLLRELPNLGEKIESGELKLNQISLVQKATREVHKTTVRNVSPQQKQELLEQLSYKNHGDSEQAVALYFDMPILQTTKKHTQADESIRVELTLSKELYEKIQEAQALLSHAVPTPDLVKYLEYVTLKVIQAKKGQPLEKGKSSTPLEAKTAKDDVDLARPMEKGKSDATVAVKVFSMKTKKRVLQQQKCCQYTDPVTKKQCGTRWFLQTDHKHSRWAGGLNTPENAQLLCSQHNRQKYLKEVRIRFV